MTFSVSRYRLSAAECRSSFSDARRINIGAVPLRTVTECLQAHRSENWDRLRELFHPDARIGVFAAGGSPDHPEVAIAAMQAAREDHSYHADVETARELDEHAVVLNGHVQHSTADGAIVVDERAWLYVVVDKRLYRSQVFRDEAAAVEAYRQLGLDLGVG